MIVEALYSKTIYDNMKAPYIKKSEQYPNSRITNHVLDYTYGLSYRYGSDEVAWLCYDILYGTSLKGKCLPAIDLIWVNPNHRGCGISRKLYSCLWNKVSEVDAICSSSLLTPESYSRWIRMSQDAGLKKYVVIEDSVITFKEVESFQDPICFESEDSRLVLSRGNIYANIGL